MYRIIKVTIYTLVLCVKLIFADHSSIGDACKLQNNNPGKCVLLKDCSSALEELREGILPKICSFHKTEPIICCPEVPEVPEAPETSGPNINEKPNTERISRKKCREYGQSVFEIVDVPTLLINFISSKMNISKCKETSHLIIRGPIAIPGQFPHMALLGYEDNGKTNWACSGVLISDEFILTTGACTLSIFGPPTIARLGTNQIKSKENDQYIVDMKLSEIIRHPDFKRPSMYNDIALLKLQHPVAFNDDLRPACLPDLNQKSDNTFLLSGWKLLSNEPFDELLNYVVKREECMNYDIKNIPNGIDNNKQLCTKEYEDACGFLYGSPLQTYDSEIYCMYNVQGILSAGNICNRGRRSVIHTNIAPYLDWIENIVWP